MARVPGGTLPGETHTPADGLPSSAPPGVPDHSSGRTFIYDQDARVWVLAGECRLAPPLLDEAARGYVFGDLGSFCAPSGRLRITRTGESAGT